jgi:DNA-binding NarL/FixJ family response regulator
MDQDRIELRRPGLKCLIADDNESILVAVNETLGAMGVDVVGTAHSGAELLGLLQKRATDAVLLDLRFGDDDSLALVRSAARLAPDAAVILYTTDVDPATISAALDAGVRGVALKQASPARLLHAIEKAVAGRTYIDPDLQPRGRLQRPGGGPGGEV